MQICPSTVLVQGELLGLSSEQEILEGIRGRDCSLYLEWPFGGIPQASPARPLGKHSSGCWSFSLVAEGEGERGGEGEWWEGGRPELAMDSCGCTWQEEPGLGRQDCEGAGRPRWACDVSEPR